MRKSHRVWCCALLLGALGAASSAQIRRLTLTEMVQAADQAIYGEIIASRAWRVDCPIDGDLYFTTITIQGRTLADGKATTVDVAFRGGFVNATDGVFNSEAPVQDDVKVGRRVVAFYRWTDDLGGGVPGNGLVAAHGGVYRTVDGPRGPAVLGKGEGYAITTNRFVAELEAAVRLLSASKPAKR
jgi:hypothetical protein